MPAEEETLFHGVIEGDFMASSRPRCQLPTLTFWLSLSLFAQRRLSTTLALHRTYCFRCRIHVHLYHLSTPRLEKAGFGTAQARSPTETCPVRAGNLLIGELKG